MLLTLPDLLSSTELSEVQQQSAALTWQDGARTAGASAAGVKRNEQAVLTSGAGRVLHERLLKRLQGNPVLRASARPKRFSRLLLSRTGPGGGYGAHVDNAIMGTGASRMRSDLSFTLFLSAPEDYAGGALEIEQPGTVSSLRPAAGSLVLYPTSAIHRVAPVTAGSRLVCVGWIQSLIPDPAQRELLFDLENLRASLRQRLDARSPELLTLNKSISNLLRMWADL